MHNIMLSEFALEIVLVFHCQGSSWSFSHSRSRYTDRSIRGKPVPPSPDPSLDPSGLSHSSPSCENGSKCGCPDAIIARRTGLTGDDEQEECSF